MKIYGWMSVSMLVLGGSFGCAQTKGATVSDNDLARVPPGAMTALNGERNAVAQAQDDVARQKLDVQSAQNEIGVADAEEKAARAQLDANRKAAKSATYDRDSGEKGSADQRESSVQATLERARAHQEAAKLRLTAAQSHQSEAEAKQELAEARLEQAKYKILQQSNDPSARQLAPGPFEDRIRNAQAKLDSARDRSKSAEASFETAQNRYTGMKGGERGLGGSGGDGR